MKKINIALLCSTIILGIASASAADTMAKDEMAKDSMAKHEMPKDGMAKHEMPKDDMSKK